MVYDYRLDVCPNHLENEFYELLGPLVTDNGGPWDEKLKYRKKTIILNLLEKELP